MMRLVLVMLLIWSTTPTLHAQPELKASEFLAWVRMHHPVMKQAALVAEKSRNDLMAAKGAFDPKLAANTSEKRYAGKNYWNTVNSYLVIPNWIGAFKAGFEQASGDYLNPQLRVPEQGLWYAGVEVPIGAGLFIDERRMQLRQARLYVEASEAEQQKIILTLLQEAASDYWNWYTAQEALKYQETAYRLAEERYRFSVQLFNEGQAPALDTVEAMGNRMSRENQVIQARLDWSNARRKVSRHLWSEDGMPRELDTLLRAASLVNEAELSQKMRWDTLMQHAQRNHPELVKMRSQIGMLETEQRFRREMLKPELNVSYQLLSDPNAIGSPWMQQNYKWGIQAGMPLFLRKERGKLKGAKTMVALRNWELTDTRREIEIALQIRLAELATLQRLLANQRNMVANFSSMLMGEQERFRNGESSVFLLNTRETNLLQAQIKLAEMEAKFAQTIAYLYKTAGVVNWMYP